MTTQVSDRASAFLTKMGVGAGRLIFALDATMSREEMWDAACEIQGEMFAEANRIGGLEVQLVYYRGLDECKASHWTQNARELADLMTRVQCRAGHTQIGRVLAHIHKEHEAQKVDAIILVGDACEEVPYQLYDVAAGLPPMFCFREGNDPDVKIVFRQLARITDGASCEFSSASARQLAELLRCVAAFAAGGRKALSKLNSESARKLLGQLKQ